MKYAKVVLTGETISNVQNQIKIIMGTSKNLSFLEVILRFNLRCFSLNHYDIMT